MSRTEKHKPTFGVTRYGQYSSPAATVTGRHATDGHRSDAGFHFAHDENVGKGKPHALILSRPKSRSATFGPRFQNISGWTRFGKAGTPSAVLRSSQETKLSIPGPGPGTYEHDSCDECRIGISLKGRWPEPESANEYPGPSDYTLDTFIGKGPAYSLSPKLLYKTYDSSPGPIYQVSSERKKGMSLTFKPFPLTTYEKNPGPAKYNTDIAAKQTFHSSPATKFGKGLFDDCQLAESPSTLTTLGPGPGAFNINDVQASGPKSPNAVITSRRTVKSEIGSGELYNLSGMTRFGPVPKKHAIFVSRHKPNDKSKNLQQIGHSSDSFTGFTNFASKKIGITLKSRLKELDLSVQNPGPAGYNLPTLIGRGPAFSLGPRYRGNFGPKSKRVTFRNVSTSECYPPMKTGLTKDTCEKSQKQQPSSPRRHLPPPSSNDIFDSIPYLEQMCLNY